jgi:D-alanyl-D-alanine carboxypeptidase
VRQQSSPLRVLLHNMMHSSDNLYAECILSALGAKVRTYHHTRVSRRSPHSVRHAVRLSECPN